MTDVYQLLQKSPDVLVPSDRSIPRAITSGQTIYEADPKSGAGRAFATLAQHYLSLVGSESAVPQDASSTAGDGAARRRLLLRRGN
jgi:Flp pilus assembly CpaE family ATPase